MASRRTDETRLRQALINLLSNAVKFSQIGQVTLRVSELEHHDGISLLRFEVCDTRIPEEPKLVDWLSDELQFQPTDEWIICPWELRLEPKNYPLLPLAKGKKLEQFIDICLRHGLRNDDLISLPFGIGCNQ